MHKPPTFGEIRFCCPHCGAIAHQYWAIVRYSELQKDESPNRFDTDLIVDLIKKEDSARDEEKIGIKFLGNALRASKGDVIIFDEGDSTYSYEVANLDTSRCDSCNQISIWLQDKLIYPAAAPTGVANLDMPSQVRTLYDEAGAVFQTSPRASAALLRLALQLLLKELGEEGKNIDKDINKLIDKGLDANLSKVFHSVRIIGNESVHPGEINVDDEPYMAEVMFGLLNQIVDQMISNPAKIVALWDRMPENKRKPVEQRLSKREKEK